MLTTQNAERRLREVEAENDRLRWEADDLRREREREDQRREEQRREALRQQNPSNRLYNGEILNFREAIAAHIQALRHERNVSCGDPEEDAKYRADFDGYIATAEALRTEYEETIGAAERALFEKWAAESEGSMKQVTGQCGLSGDYSALAI